MIRNAAFSFPGVLLDLIDSLISEIRTRMIATKLIRSAAATVANYRAAQRARRRGRVPSRMCLVLEDCDQCKAWLERFERKRSSRKLEPLHDAIVAAGEIIATTFPTRSHALAPDGLNPKTEDEA
jgi:hypothetical protein